MAKYTLFTLQNYLKLNQCTKCNSNLVRYCSSASKQSEHYDMVISGGGMIGSTLACTLGKNTKLSNKRILLLESGKPIKWTTKEKYSNRVSALNQNTYNLLNQIGAWKHISAVRSAPVQDMQVWDAISDAVITFNRDTSSKVVAHIVENGLLMDAVAKELSQLTNVHIRNEVKINKYSFPQTSAQQVTIELENGEVFTCNLLLGCDGFNSQVRQSMGVTFVSWKYDQKAIVATLKFSEPVKNVTAWQRFLPTGPIALLPLSENYSSLVWCTSPDLADYALKLNEEQFVNEVNEALWKVYASNSIIEESTKTFNKFLEWFQLPTSNRQQLPPKIVEVEKESIASFPLGFGHATRYIAERVVLVGDAAHRVHPLAGQGVNLGFGDVATLNELLGEAAYSGREIGHISDLREYETRRQRHNVPTMIAIDGLHKLYNTDFLPVVLLRSFGLQFTNAINPLKTAFIDHAGK